MQEGREVNTGTLAPPGRVILARCPPSQCSAFFTRHWLAGLCGVSEIYSFIIPKPFQALAPIF